MTVDVERAADLAEEAYVWGLYPVVTYETRYIYTQAMPVGVNRFLMNEALAGPENRRVVTPNATTLYGAAFIDLSAEPFVIELPALDGRYFSLQVMDHYGDYFLEAGEPFTGTEARRFVLAGPTWTGALPPRLNMRELIAAPSDTVWAILRVAVTDRSEADLAAARAFLGRVVAMPLGEWERGAAAAAGRQGRLHLHPRMPELTSLYRDATAADYFEILALCLNDPTYTKRTDSVAERELLARLAEIGIAAGRPSPSRRSTRRRAPGSSRATPRANSACAERFATSTIDMNGGGRSAPTGAGSAPTSCAGRWPARSAGAAPVRTPTPPRSCSRTPTGSRSRAPTATP